MRRAEAGRSARKQPGNTEWITAHFEELVDRYGGRYVAVGRGRLVASGRQAAEVLRLASREVPEDELSLFKVPRREELVCVLPLSRI